MSKNLELLQKKAKEAKSANAFVSALRKYEAARGDVNFVDSAIKSTSLVLHTEHMLQLLFIHCALQEGFGDIAQGLVAKIKDEADFYQKISLAAVVSEFKDKEEGVAIAEEAFESIEGTDDYIFHALNGVEAVVANTSLDGPVPLTVGDKDYKLSTIESVLDDVMAARDSISNSELIEYLGIFARALYVVGDIARGNEVFLEAIENFSEEGEVSSLLNSFGEIEVPGKTVYDATSIVFFPDDVIKAKLNKLFKDKLSGDNLEYALSWLEG